MASKSRKDKIVIPPAKGYTCMDISLENAMKFVLDVETNEWVIDSTEGGFYDGAKVLHFHLRYVGDSGFCPECNGPLTIHDYKEREWRHDNLGDLRDPRPRDGLQHKRLRPVRERIGMQRHRVASEDQMDDRCGDFCRSKYHCIGQEHGE